MPSCRHSQPTLNVGRDKTGGTLLKRDPTRTTLIRAAFMAEMRRRFAKLRRQVWEFMVTLDALGLDDRKDVKSLSLNVQPRQFEFLTDSGKLKSFNAWFKQAVESNILSVAPGSADPDTPWTAKYVESAYKRGMINAYLATRSQAMKFDEDFLSKSQEEFLRDSFLQPERVSKVEFLATRSYEQLKGITATMGSDMNRILAQGMVDGLGARAVARKLTDKISSLTNTRAMTLARTEIIAAHADGQLDTFEDLGVEELGLKSEFSTAGDDRVCPICSALEGKVYTVEEARGVIPQHPACRCSWLPWIESEHGKGAKKK